MAPAAALGRCAGAVLCLLLGGMLGGVGGCLAPVRWPLAVWVVGGGEELGPDTPPRRENDTYSAAAGTISLTAAINETVAFQVGLHTDAPPAGPYRLEVSDLRGVGGTLAARSCVALYRARYVRVERFRSWYPEHTGRPATPRLFPDILVPWGAPHGGGPLKLEGSRNELVWVDVRVPPGTAPGQYSGRVGLYEVSSGREVFGSALRLEVLPLALPSAPSLPLICRVDPRDLLGEHLGWPRSGAEATRLLPDAPSHQAAVRLVGAAMRLFHEHRATPVLWAAFPKYRLLGQRRVEIDWEPYDRLVGGWIDGSGFPDRVGLARWPIPVSLAYPDAERNGGFDSPRYARLLAAYLAECRRHFAARGWLERAFVRLCAPGPLTAEAVARVRRASGILRQSESGLPLVAHLPPRSLRGLGWHDAPAVELPLVDIWAPPAMWYEPPVMAQQRTLGKQTWFQPDQPPYSGALDVAAPAVDARVLAWQAYRYGSQAIWLEHPAECARRRPEHPPGASGPAAALLYPGKPYGLLERPVPSLRLKRLRRGLEDYELLRLLERRGGQLLGQRIARQVVRWAGTEACLEDLLSCRPSGWPLAGEVLARARQVLLRELASRLKPQGGAPAGQPAAWTGLMNRPGRIQLVVRGVRLLPEARRLRARVFLALLNSTEHTVRGRWRLAAPPVGWEPPAPLAVSVAPNGWRTASCELALAGLAYNTEGVYPFELRFDSQTVGAFRVPGRLAVAACPYVETAPLLDGELSDWISSAGNAAGDFQLCRGRRAEAPPGQARRPTLATRALFCMDADNLYLAVRCALRRGERPLWQADNAVPVDGPVPWGQDVVEVLLDTRGVLEGSASDLLVLQFKPNGVLLARRGCRTEPPMGVSRAWQSRARIVVRVRPEAWVAELALPLAALGRQALRRPVWGLNVTRLDARRGEYSSWSGARGHCYLPQSLGNLVLLRP